MDDIKQIMELVTSSPLEGSQKEELQKILETEGSSENFYSQFNSLLLSDLEQRAEEYKKAATEQEQKIDHADQELARKREKINDQLKTHLAKLTPNDLAQSRHVWDEYYKAVATIEDEYKSTLQEA